jgi:uncharacterized protein YjeT (DUF2065 family)
MTGDAAPDPDMWHDLWIAFALVLVIEGVWPFLSPGGMRRALLFAAAQDDRSLRTAGLVSMLAGLALLYLVN